MALPALRAIKKKFPESYIYLIAKDYLKDIFRNIDEIHEIITIPNDSKSKDLFKTAATLKRYNFNQGILLTNSFKSALLFRLEESKSRKKKEEKKQKTHE
jgi:ADP-heptose:LPS heptosyltransferase